MDNKDPCLFTPPRQQSTNSTLQSSDHNEGSNVYAFPPRGSSNSQDLTLSATVDSGSEYVRFDCPVSLTIKAQCGGHFRAFPWPATASTEMRHGRVVQTYVPSETGHYHHLKTEIIQVFHLVDTKANCDGNEDMGFRGHDFGEENSNNNNKRTMTDVELMWKNEFGWLPINDEASWARALYDAAFANIDHLTIKVTPIKLSPVNDQIHQEPGQQTSETQDYIIFDENEMKRQKYAQIVNRLSSTLSNIFCRSIRKASSSASMCYNSQDMASLCSVLDNVKDELYYATDCIKAQGVELKEISKELVDLVMAAATDRDNLKDAFENYKTDIESLVHDMVNSLMVSSANESDHKNQTVPQMNNAAGSTEEYEMHDLTGYIPKQYNHYQHCQRYQQCHQHQDHSVKICDPEMNTVGHLTAFYEGEERQKLVFTPYPQLLLSDTDLDGEKPLASLQEVYSSNSGSLWDCATDADMIDLEAQLHDPNIIWPETKDLSTLPAFSSSSSLDDINERCVQELYGPDALSLLSSTYSSGGYKAGNEVIWCSGSNNSTATAMKSTPLRNDIFSTGSWDSPVQYAYANNMIQYWHSSNDLTHAMMTESSDDESLHAQSDTEVANEIIADYAQLSTDNALFAEAAADYYNLSDDRIKQAMQKCQTALTQLKSSSDKEVTLAVSEIEAIIADIVQSINNDPPFLSTMKSIKHRHVDEHIGCFGSCCICDESEELLPTLAWGISDTFLNEIRFQFSPTLRPSSISASPQLIVPTDEQKLGIKVDNHGDAGANDNDEEDQFAAFESAVDLDIVAYSQNNVSTTHLHDPLIDIQMLTAPEYIYPESFSGYHLVEFSTMSTNSGNPSIDDDKQELCFFYGQERGDGIVEVKTPTSTPVMRDVDCCGYLCEEEVQAWEDNANSDEEFEVLADGDFAIEEFN